MNLRKSLALVCIANLFGSSAQAAGPIPADVYTQATTTLANDSTLVSNWLVNQVKYVIPFNSTSGNVVPSQLKLFGIEAGVEGVVSGTKLDTDALHNLPTTVINTKSIDTFSRFPFPMVLAHAKIGLPFGLDGGVRIGGIPKTNINNANNKTSIKNGVFGLDVRKKIIDEGVMMPFGLTVGLNYTHADGSVDVTSTYNTFNQTVNSGGTNYNVALNNGQSTQHTDWKTNSFGLQAIMDKKILFIAPYIGASVNRNSGNIDNSITSTGTAEVNGDPTTDQNLTAIGSSSATANKWDVRGLLGVEFTFFPFLKLGLGGEYAGSKNVAGTLGLRFQFR